MLALMFVVLLLCVARPGFQWAFGVRDSTTDTLDSSPTPASMRPRAPFRGAGREG